MKKTISMYWQGSESHNVLYKKMPCLMQHRFDNKFSSPTILHKTQESSAKQVIQKTKECDCITPQKSQSAFTNSMRSSDI